MPAIRIRNDSSAYNGPPMIMLEYQGRIETTLADTDCCVFGHVNYEDLTMTIGNQRIKGRKVKLSKPFAVVLPDKENNCFKIANIITEKILFDSRPMTVMK